jgi:site-specific DNA-cytosine methylase
MLRCRSALELFCGIGGWAAAVDGWVGTPASVTALDIDRTALVVHQHNFPQHHRIVAELASFDIRRSPADFWWLSPPCLPFTRKGPQRDLRDRRTEALVHLIGQIGADSVGPIALAIENVPPFADSQTAAWIDEHLQRAGFETGWEIRCPSELGWPMRRRRAYLVASRVGLRDLAPAVVQRRCLAELLDPPAVPDPDPAEALSVPDPWLQKYAAAIDIVDPQQSDCQAACFTSSYGRSPVRSGSYLRCDPSHDRSAVRFFTPTEILRCLGFPESFTWPAAVALQRRWELAGNSVSLPVVRWVLSRLGFDPGADA